MNAAAPRPTPIMMRISEIPLMSPQTASITREGVCIDGKPFVLLSGCVHYFRWPKGEWRALLEQAKWAGLNTIDTVIPWNRHEPLPGQFDFAEEADLGAFLDLCGALGLYAIVRPGPYICAEWENGGLPAWLTADGDIRLRTDDPRYTAPLRRWYEALMPIITARQVQHGGPVLLCQIENEHLSSGVYGADPHQGSLAAMAEAFGVQVPQYTCVGPMRGYPEFRNGWSGMAEKLQQTRALWPENPMIVSELWSGWFDNWGSSRHTHKTAARLDITLHQLTAVGAAGFSHWMWAGGTNFGFWGGRTVGDDMVFMTTSYDYGAPIDEDGRLTDKALVARRHHLFLGTLGTPLSSVLADALPGGLTIIPPATVPGRGEAGAAPYRTVRAAANAPAAWADFRCTYLYNPTLEGQTYQIFLPDGRRLPVEVEAATIKPIFCRMPLGESGLRLEHHTGRILGFWHQDQGDLLVIYGQPGEVGEVAVTSNLGGLGDLPGLWKGLPDLPGSPRHLAPSITGNTLHIRYWVGDAPQQITAMAGDRRLTVLIMRQDQAERFSPETGSQQVARPEPAEGHAPRPIPLAVERLAVAELGDGAGGWRAIERPEAMERLGCMYGYGWYRAELELDAPLAGTVAAPWLADRARLLVDGADVGHLGVGPSGPRFSAPLSLPAGRHTLHILADNLGRYNYGLQLGDRKGLLDTLYAGAEEEDISGGWAALWQEAAFAGETIAHASPRHLRPDAEPVHLGAIPHSGPAIWLLREIAGDPARRTILHLSGDRNAGAVYVNGEALIRFSRHRSPGALRVDISHMLRPGANVLALHITPFAAAPWQATLLRYDPAQPLPARWSFRPGVTPGPPGAATHGPACYRATFVREQIPANATALRLRVGDLHKGQIWLNGRNIGRYWQIGPQDNYKLPLTWLADQNELLLFAEEGHTQYITVEATPPR